VLARSRLLNEEMLLRADEEIAFRSGSFFTYRVANAHARPETSRGLAKVILRIA
jgi:hypothetical protein